MVVYIVQRILAAIPVMGFVALFVFLLLRLTPGDPAAIIAGDTATPEQLAAIRESLGLNDPMFVQFYNWITQLLQGNFCPRIFDTGVRNWLPDDLAVFDAAWLVSGPGL